jgi:hypothetical protein
MFEDPWGGFHKAKDDDEAKKKAEKQEFETFFKGVPPMSTNRNKPALSSL